MIDWMRKMFRLDEPPEKVADPVDEFIDGVRPRCYEGQAHVSVFLTMYPEETTNPENNKE